MAHKELINKLIHELSYRVGIPNVKDKNHQSIMSEILSEWGEFDAKKRIFEFLTEAEPEKTPEDEKYVNTGGSGYIKKTDQAKYNKEKKDFDGETFTKEGPGVYKEIEKDSKTTTPDAKTGAAVGKGTDYAKNAEELEDRVANKDEEEEAGAGGKNSDVKSKSIDDLITSFLTEKDDIIQGKKSPPGTGGSAIGEMYGGTAISDFYESSLSEDEFIENHFEDVRNSSMSNGMDDAAIKTWLKVSYKTGVSEINELKTNSKYRFKEPQPDPYPIPVMDPVNKKGSARKGLITLFKQKLENTTNDVSKKHYERQLRFIKSREDSDTGILYETKEGNIGFKHTSNKKGFNDPVFNSTVNKRGQVMKETISVVSTVYNLNEEATQKIENSIDTTIKKAVSSIQEAGLGPSGALQSNVSDTTEFAKKNNLGKQFKNLDAGQGGRKNYLEDIRKEIKTNLGLGKKINTSLEQQGIPQPYSDDDIAGTILEISKSGDTTTSVTKMVVKLSDNVKLAREIHTRLRNKYTDISEDEIKQKTLETINGYKNQDGVPFDKESLDMMLSSEMDWIEKVGSQTRDAMGEAHKQIVNDLSSADEKYQRENAPNPPQPPLNGPHKQAYVESYMKQMHWDRYILGEQEDIGDMNIAGKSVNSELLRGCISNLSGYEGDLSSPEGKKGLMTHLRKTMQISSESQSLTFSSNQGKKQIELGKESYRTKGVGRNSLLGNFGKDLQKCLKES